MFYETKQQLPDDVRRELPEKAQEIFKAVYNSTWKKYEVSGETDKGDTDALQAAARHVAWLAVKEQYQKQGGRWVPVGEAG